jgi:hypothetical protein
VRKHYTLRWRRALFIAALPGIGIWWAIRRTEQSPKDRAFTRTPRIIEIVPSVFGVAGLTAGLLAGSKLLLFGGIFLCFVYASRLLARLSLPRKIVRTEREFLALTVLTFHTHVAVYALLVLSIRAEQWLMVGILLAFIAGATVLGAWLLRLMAHGMVDEDGNPIPIRFGHLERTMTTATRRPRGR